MSSKFCVKVWCWGWFLGAFCSGGGSRFVVLLVSFCYSFLVLCVCACVRVCVCLLLFGGVL
jgi:hypothetical protein